MLAGLLTSVFTLRKLLKLLEMLFFLSSFFNLYNKNRNSTHLHVGLYTSRGTEHLRHGWSIGAGFRVLAQQMLSLLGATRSIALANHSLCWGLARRMSGIQGR